MITHELRTYKSAEHLPREGQLAWKIAEVAADPVAVAPEVAEMIVNRIIDNAAVAAASVGRRPVASARAQALCHALAPGATVFGVDARVSPEWAAWANGTAVRELDFHDTFLAADYSHPGDNIPPILAVAWEKAPASNSMRARRSGGAADRFSGDTSARGELPWAWARTGSRAAPARAKGTVRRFMACFLRKGRPRAAQGIRRWNGPCPP